MSNRAKKIKELWDMAFDQSEIAQQLGISRQLVWYHLKQGEGARRRADLSEDAREAVRKRAREKARQRRAEAEGFLE